MTYTINSHRRRAILHVCTILAAGALFGCPPVPKQTTTMPATTDFTLMPAIGTEPTAGGIFLPLASHDPLQGDKLKRALMTRAQIAAATKSSPALTTAPASQPATQSASTQKSPATEDAEPPPLAVKYYLQGREKFLDGANSEAMDFLDKALALDPNAFTVLRLMGRVCFASSQLAKGSLFLQRAYSIDPADVEVNYLLGRYWLEGKDGDRAVSHLMQADDSSERRITSAQTPLVTFYLARALQAAGYHKEAAAEYERFLANIELPVAGYRYDRELNYLIDENWAVHLATAENLALIGDFAKSIPHYQLALRHEPTSAFVAARLTDALLRAGAGQDARRTALNLVKVSNGSPDSVQLLTWTYKATHKDANLLSDLRAQIKGDDNAAATLTLAATQDYLGKKSDAFETIRAYVETHPADLAILARLLKRVDSAQKFVLALHATGAVIAKTPEKTDDILKLFVAITETPAAVDFVHTEASHIYNSWTPYECYLVGITLRAQREPVAAEDAFRHAAALRSFFPAREALASTLTVEDKFKEASDLIQDAIAHNEGGVKAYELLIESEGAQEHLANALKIAKEARVKFPDSPELRLQLAMIYRLRGQDPEADAELSALIDGSPKFEPAYRNLINSALSRADDARRSGQDAEKFQLQAITYLSKLMREIPGSTFGRITTAILNARDGLEESEAILKRVVADEPDDIGALIPLAEVLQALRQPDEAAATFTGPLKTHPTPELVEALASFYRRRQDKSADALALTAKYMADNPNSEDYIIVHAAELDAQKKSAEAQSLLIAALPKFPKSQALAVALARVQEKSAKPADAPATMRAFIDKNGATAARLYLLAHFQSVAGLEEGNEATLEKILALNPDHAGANNDLGYLWADQGRNLERAEIMVKKALDNRPNDSAFLDSLAWVYYKQGKFAEAVSISQRAIEQPRGQEPEVLQHLADALYRAGKTDEANERWIQARAVLVSPRTDEEERNAVNGERILTKDEQKIKTYLDAVLDAFKAGNEPALSPLAKKTNP